MYICMNITEKNFTLQYLGPDAPCLTHSVYLDATFTFQAASGSSF
jgi:hypothetical protein